MANDSKANYLLQNQGKGMFKEVALLSGVAYNEDGNAQACMGIDFADYDDDGFIDLIVTNFARDSQHALSQRTEWDIQRFNDSG